MVLARVVAQADSTIGSYSELKRRVREALARGRERAAGKFTAFSEIPPA